MLHSESIRAGIAKFLENELKAFEVHGKMNSNLRERVKDTILERAGGIFLVLVQHYQRPINQSSGDSTLEIRPVL